MNNDLSAIILLVVFVIGAVVLINLVTRCSEEDRIVYDTAQNQTATSQIQNADTLTDTTKATAQSYNLMINSITQNGKNYECVITAVNQSSRPKSYKLHAELQRQPSGKAYVSCFDIGEQHINMMEPGQQKRMHLIIPDFERDRKNKYRIYLQLMDTNDNSEIFVDDAVKEF